jgi:hypothetical protein
MKNISFKSAIPVIILCGMLSMAGCKKYTEVDPVSQYSVAQTFSDVSNATSALIGV